ncbi:MAG: hypothetical protein QOH56_722 [Pseudonocardiales bacterium]|nr:hypothetical protein [Pseudonocardiales bacterium]
MPPSYSMCRSARSLRAVRHLLTFLSSWSWDPTVVVPLLAAGLCYLWCVHTVDRSHPSQPWAQRNTWCFAAGLALVWIAIIGPFGWYDDVFFWAHMVQHMVLMMLAAPLLVLGAPGLLLLRVANPSLRRRYVVPLLRSRAVRHLTNPVLTWLAFVAVLGGTHFSPFYEFALSHDWVHRFVEHPLYLGIALIYYYSVIGKNPAPRKLKPSLKVISLLAMMVPEGVTGFFLYASPYVLYSHYSKVVRPFGPSPLADQQLGGSLMWAGSMLLDTAWVALAAGEWLRHDATHTRRSDLASVRRVSGASTGSAP